MDSSPAGVFLSRPANNILPPGTVSGYPRCVKKRAQENPGAYNVSLSRIKDLPGHRRPREMALEVGVENVPDEVLLAILLRTGTSGRSVIDVARALLDRFKGSLSELAQASQTELAELEIPGFGPVKQIELRAALELGRRAMREPSARLPLMREPVHVRDLLETKTVRLNQECVWMLPLDQKYRLLRAPVEITKGILNASLSHPREIYREAIRLSAAAVIIVHNHPSGDPTPSAEDIATTRQLVETGRIIGIQLLDHVIIGGGRPSPAPYVSLRESGLVAFE